MCNVRCNYLPGWIDQHTKDLDKQVYGLQVSKLVVICIDTYTKEEAGIATIYNLVISELGETRWLAKTRSQENQKGYLRTSTKLD